MDVLMQTDEIKRKIRKLKRAEETIRFGSNGGHDGELVWNRFFSLRDIRAGQAKYALADLSSMNTEEYKSVVSEYFAFVYYELYKSRGIIFGGRYDPEILAKLGLPAFAAEQDIRRRFRELARRYHPDAGGDAAMFIELMDSYRALMDMK